METQDQILFLYCLLAHSLSGRKVLRGMFWELSVRFLSQILKLSRIWQGYPQFISNVTVWMYVPFWSPTESISWVWWQEAVQFVQCLVDEGFWSQDSNPPLRESQPLSNSAICSGGNVTIKSLCPPPMSHKEFQNGKTLLKTGPSSARGGTQCYVKFTMVLKGFFKPSDHCHQQQQWSNT